MEAWLPAKLSLMGLYARSLYHTLFGTDEELKLLSLFAGPAATSPTELLVAKAPTINAWSIDRTWRAVQRQWGIDPGPDPAVPPPPGQQPGHGQGQGQGGGRDTGAEAQAHLKDAHEKVDEVLRRFREEGEEARVRGEGEDEFSFEEGESDFGGTVAIVMLCIFLGSVVDRNHCRSRQFADLFSDDCSVLFMMRQNAAPAANHPHAQPAAPPAPGATPQAPAPAAAPTAAAAQAPPQEQVADGVDLAGEETETEPEGVVD